MFPHFLWGPRALGAGQAWVLLFGVAAAILIAGVAIELALSALAELLPHDPSTCGGG